ncbi:MAG: hypothetical protein R3E44_10570 [Paracoccaceae bacterium]
MRFFKLTTEFQNEEDGAVTVDWVVLTAAVVGLGVATLTAIKISTNNISGRVANYMSTISVP